MMKDLTISQYLLLFVCLFLIHACDNNDTQPAKNTPAEKLTPYPIASTPLPADLVWESNERDPEFSDKTAKRGGTFREFVLSFPLTLRLVGPDSNHSFAHYTRALNMSLIDVQPNTLNPIPALATHWAFGTDNKTVYFKIDPDARWSDGLPVTADDFVYSLEFMRSKFIIDPFSNDYYTTQIANVIKYDDHTIAVVSANPKPADELLQERANIRPVPRHFYKLDKNWVRDYNWQPEPSTAAYKISDVRKGKYVEFSRLKDWWANDKRYYRNRFNPDKIHVKVIRDINIAWQYFEKGELDSFPLTLPDFWYNKAKGKLFDKGYIDKIWFYNSVPQPSQGLWINMTAPPLDDIRVRYALAFALDFDRINNTILHGDYTRLDTQNVGYGAYDNKAIKARSFDIKRAVSYLTETGWTNIGDDGTREKNGSRLSLTISYGQPAYTDRLAMLKEDAKKAGIELQLQFLDSSAFFKQVLEKKHQIAMLGYSAGGLSPEYWQFYHSDNANKPQTNNITNFSDPQMDKWIDTYRLELNKDTRVDLAHKMEKKLFDASIFIPSFKTPYTREAYWRWIKLPKGYATRSSSAVVDVFGSGLFWIDVEEKNRLMAIMRAGTALPPSTITDTTWK